MKVWRKILIFLPIICFFLVLPPLISPVYSNDPIPAPSSWLQNAGQLIQGKVARPTGSPAPSTTLPTGGLNDFIIPALVPFIINLLLFIVFLTSLIFLIIGGIMWMTSGGEKEGLAKAKSSVTYAILGLALGLGSFLIISIIQNFFGVSIGMGYPITPFHVGLTP